MMNLWAVNLEGAAAAQLRHAGHQSRPEFTGYLCVIVCVCNTGSVLKSIFPKVLYRSGLLPRGEIEDRSYHQIDGCHGSHIHTWKQSHGLGQPGEASRGSRYGDTDQSFKNGSPPVCYTSLSAFPLNKIVHLQILLHLSSIWCSELREINCSTSVRCTSRTNCISGADLLEQLWSITWKKTLIKRWYVLQSNW